MSTTDAVYFFTGADEAKKNLAINKIKSKLSFTPESLDYNLYYAKDTQPGDIINTLKTPPFLNKCRLVVLKEAEYLPESESSS